MVETGSRLFLKEGALPPAGLQQYCGRAGFIVPFRCLLLSLLPASSIIIEGFFFHESLLKQKKNFLATIALSTAPGQLRLRLYCIFSVELKRALMVMQRCIKLVTKPGAQQSQARLFFVLNRILPLCCVL